MSQAVIGVFDSGVGGLTVLRELQRLIPNHPIVYFADQENIPYGSRSLEEVHQLADGITRYLLKQKSGLIVVACNAASAAALRDLRAAYPRIPFVGMEPAVKPAAETTQTNRLAVLATPATFQGALFASVVDRFAQGVEVVEIVVPGLVELIEGGPVDSQEVYRLLEEPLASAEELGIDTLVLACTHYAFVIPTIEKILGPSVRVIDPAPAIARQAERLVEHHGLAGAGGEVRYVTSGDPESFRSSLSLLLRQAAEVEQARWSSNSLQS